MREKGRAADACRYCIMCFFAEAKGRVSPNLEEGEEN